MKTGNKKGVSQLWKRNAVVAVIAVQVLNTVDPIKRITLIKPAGPAHEGPQGCPHGLKIRRHMGGVIGQSVVQTLIPKQGQPQLQTIGLCPAYSGVRRVDDLLFFPPV